jgi:hypothetical protein
VSETPDDPYSRADIPDDRVVPIRLRAPQRPPEPDRTDTPAPSPAWPAELNAAFAEAGKNARSKHLHNADRASIEDPRAFRRRFLFTTDRDGRDAIIRLQARTGLTDRQIGLLWHTSNIRLVGTQAMVTAGERLYLAGVYFIGLLAFLMFLVLLGALSIDDRTPQQALIVGLIEFGLLGVGYIVFLMFIRPVQIRRRLKELKYSDVLWTRHTAS